MQNRAILRSPQPAMLAMFLLFIGVTAGCEPEQAAQVQQPEAGREIKYAPQTKRVAQLNLKLPAEPAPIDVPALLREKRCHLCHEEEREALGPPYEAIRLAHKTRGGVMLDVLAQKIVRGGSGNWGVVPMVPNEHVSPEEARLMAAWILGPG